MRKFLFFIFAMALVMQASTSAAEEISLYNSAGKAVAYIDVGDDLTIYLWDGKPVAYLDGENVYGFNGKHLGWFDDGAIYAHDGNAVCVMKHRYSGYTEYENYKKYKKYKPYKSYKKLAPPKRRFTRRFSSVPCSLALAFGGK